MRDKTSDPKHNAERLRNQVAKKPFLNNWAREKNVRNISLSLSDSAIDKIDITILIPTREDRDGAIMNRCSSISHVFVIFERLILQGVDK